MEKEFIEWFDANEKRFIHANFDEKQIAYSAWLEGQKQASRIHDISVNSKCKCKKAQFTRMVDDDFNPLCGKCGRAI